MINHFILIKEFQTRCPFGKKTKLYKKAKIEKFAEYLLKDGLVSSLSSYNDYECEYWVRTKPAETVQQPELWNNNRLLVTICSMSESLLSESYFI